ncbi:MAG: hypothetical protein HRU26_09670 [Psychroserpens sp.]|nr:hypothetical protein [Psychroserpens sp.]
MKKNILDAIVVLGIAIAFIVVVYDITDASQSTYQNTDLEGMTAQTEVITIDDTPQD